jgi:hypothetical protein
MNTPHSRAATLARPEDKVTTARPRVPALRSTSDAAAWLVAPTGTTCSVRHRAGHGARSTMRSVCRSAQGEIETIDPAAAEAGREDLPYRERPRGVIRRQTNCGAATSPAIDPTSQDGESAPDLPSTNTARGGGVYLAPSMTSRPLPEAMIRSFAAAMRRRVDVDQQRITWVAGRPLERFGNWNRSTGGLFDDGCDPAVPTPNRIHGQTQSHPEMPR